MKWTSRLVPAVALGLVVLLVSGLLMSAATASNDATETPGFGRPLLGDTGTYETRLALQVPGIEENLPLVRDDFAWADAGTVVDRFGRHLAGERVDVLTTHVWDVDMSSMDGFSWENTWRRSLVFASGHSDLLFAADRHSSTSTMPSYSLLGPGTPQSHTSDVEFRTFARFPVRSCLFAFGVDDIPEGSTAPVTRNCLEFGNVTFTPRWTERGVHLQAAGAVLELEFQYGLPYPLRISMEDDRLTDPLSEANETVRIRMETVLVGFQAGEVPRAPPVPLGPAPVVPKSAWTAATLDDRGVALAFPLSRAIAVALADPLYPDARTFMEEHPQAYVATAWTTAVAQEGYRVRSWFVTLADDKAAHHMVINETRLPNGDAAGPVVDDALATTSTSTYVPRDIEGNPMQPRFPARQLLPKELPTAKAIVERWQAHTQEPTLGYGFVAACHADCSTGTMYLLGGEVLAAMDDGFPVDTYPVVVGNLNMSLSAGMMFADSELGTDFLMVSSFSYGDAPSGSQTKVQMMESSRAPFGLAILNNPAASTGAGLASLAAGVLYYVWPALKSGGMIGLFSRTQEPELAQHPKRRNILDAVAAEPGIHFQALARKTGQANGALVHHVTKLKDAGLLREIRSGNYTCYFLPGTSKNEVAVGAATRSAGAQAVLASLVENPGATAPEIAQACGLRLSTAQYHAARLSEAGIVRPVRDGRVVRYHLQGANPAA